MENISQYLEKWALSEPEKLASTFTSDVYKVRDAQGAFAVLKVLNDKGKTFESDSFGWFEHMDGQGAAKAYRHDDGAVLLEYLDGGELAALVFDGKDEEATDIALDVIAKLHSHTHNLPSYRSLEEHCRALFDDYVDVGLSEKARATFRRLIDTQDDGDIRLMHGDFHHHNILKGARGWVAIDPQKVIGDRHYEPSNLFQNPCDYDGIFEESRIDMIADKASQKLQLDRDRVLAFGFVHMVLSACWSVMDEQDPSIALKMAGILSNKIG